MVLHIAIEGVDGVGKTTQLEHLKKFFTKKKYEVTIIKQPNTPELIKFMQDYFLSQEELALLMAVDRLITYNGMRHFFHYYDIVFWDRSILSSYAYNTTETVDDKFITDINRYFPDMDLYIVIDNHKFLEKSDYQNDTTADEQKIILKYQKLVSENKNIISIPYIDGAENKVFESIVQTIYEYFPRCNWCGHVFKKTTENRKYCKKSCSDYAREEQNRINALKHYHDHKDEKPAKLGSYGANLHSHMNPDHEKEKRLIQNEKRRLRI